MPKPIDQENLLTYIEIMYEHLTEASKVADSLRDSFPPDQSTAEWKMHCMRVSQQVYALSTFKKDVIDIANRHLPTLKP